MILFALISMVLPPFAIRTISRSEREKFPKTTPGHKDMGWWTRIRRREKTRPTFSSWT